MKEKQISLNSGRDINEVDTQKSGLAKAGHTSKYGAKNAAEFFAEAVSDVYAHGKDAKPMSIEIVQEYERRRTDATKKNFFVQQKNQPGWWKRTFGWLKFW